MKEIYFITATNTDVGKTYASEIYLNKLAKKGKQVGYLKPFETGVTNIASDGSKLLKTVKKLNNKFNFTVNDIVPFQFKLPAAPYIAALYENRIIDTNIIFNTIDKLLKKCDVLVIEGAGGLYVPLTKDYFIVNLIKDIQDRYNSKTILISPSNLGSINDTLLSQKLLEDNNISFKWYINLHKDEDSFHTITLPFYKNYFKKVKFL